MTKSKGEGKNNSDKFFSRLVDFYQESLSGAADMVDTLAGIEETFPNEYKTLKGIKDDPDAINKMLTKAPQEIKDKLIVVMFKAGNLTQRINKLFDLSASEKRQLAKDLRKFSEESVSEIKS